MRTQLGAAAAPARRCPAPLQPRWAANAPSQGAGEEESCLTSALAARFAAAAQRSCHAAANKVSGVPPSSLAGAQTCAKGGVAAPVLQPQTLAAACLGQCRAALCEAVALHLAPRARAQPVCAVKDDPLGLRPRECIMNGPALVRSPVRHGREAAHCSYWVGVASRAREISSLQIGAGVRGTRRAPTCDSGGGGDVERTISKAIADGISVVSRM